MRSVIRDAIHLCLEWLGMLGREFRDQRGYAREPDSEEDLTVWESVAAWPEE